MNALGGPEISLAASTHPATFVGQALQEIVVNVTTGGDDNNTTNNTLALETCQRGILVDKISTRGKFQPRYLTLSRDHFWLYVTPQPLVLDQKTQHKGLLRGPILSRKTWQLKQPHLRGLDVADWCGLQVGVVGTRNLEQARTVNRLNGKDSVVDQRAHELVSILYAGGTKSLDVAIPNRADLEALVHTLHTIRQTYVASKVWVNHEALLLRYLWRDIVQDAARGISRGEFRTQLLPRLNLEVAFPRIVFRKHLKQVARDMKPHPDETRMAFRKRQKTTRHLTFTQLFQLLQQLKRPKDGPTLPVDTIWQQEFGNDQTSIDASTFLTFLHTKQQMTTLTLADVHGLMDTLHVMERYSRGGQDDDDKETAAVADGELTLTKAQFELYLLDRLNQAYDPVALSSSTTSAQQQQYSLSEYWINSSHNTYLVGDQLRSASSVSCYLNALRRGCKCLELDCWDGVTAPDEQGNNIPWPVIFHGHTLTSKILFRDVIVAVATYLKSNPDTYPVVLSLENHCTLPFQEQMARDLKTYLGDALYYPTPQDDQQLPPPQALLGKILIKGKRPPEKEDEEEGEVEEEDDATVPVEEEVEEVKEEGAVIEQDQEKTTEPADDAKEGADEEPADDANVDSAVAAVKESTDAEVLDEKVDVNVDSAVEAVKETMDTNDLVDKVDAASGAAEGVDEKTESTVDATKDTKDGAAEAVDEKVTAPTESKADTKTDTTTVLAATATAAPAPAPAPAPIKPGSSWHPTALGNKFLAMANKRTPADPKEKKFSSELAAMTLMHGDKYKNFSASMAMPATHMHSISETKMAKLLGSSKRRKLLELGKKKLNLADAWREYNQTHLTRTYPKGSRVDSSNYCPVLAWAVGCQLVALNFQTSDKHLILNDGRFRENGQCGYVLKPDAVPMATVASTETTTNEESIEATPPVETNSNINNIEHHGELEDFVTGIDLPPRRDLSSIPQRWQAPLSTLTHHTKPLQLSIRILSGSCLPKPYGATKGETIDPYVKVTLFNVTTDSESGKLSLVETSSETSVVNNNGYCPVWKDEAAQTFCVESPEYSLLYFQLKEKDLLVFDADERVAECAIPVHRLRPGVRSLQLYDLHNLRAGSFDFSSLLVEIGITPLTKDDK